MKIWLAATRDYEEKENKVKTFGEKKFFKERLEAIAFIIKHYTKYNKLLHPDELSAAYDLICIDVNKIPEFKKFYTTHGRKMISSSIKKKQSEKRLDSWK